MGGAREREKERKRRQSKNTGRGERERGGDQIVNHNNVPNLDIKCRTRISPPRK
jgi:hypothetical protein